MPGKFAVIRLSQESVIPQFAYQSSFYSITKTADELSLVCEQYLVPSEFKAEKDWRILKVDGVLDFGLTGILSSILNPLAEAKISIFALSTFDTDYILLKSEILTQALDVLCAQGFEIWGQG